MSENLGIHIGYIYDGDRSLLPGDAEDRNSMGDTARSILAGIIARVLAKSGRKLAYGELTMDGDVDRIAIHAEPPFTSKAEAISTASEVARLWRPVPGIIGDHKKVGIDTFVARTD